MFIWKVLEILTMDGGWGRGYEVLALMNASSQFNFGQLGIAKA
jgi:hypothetical protein